MMGLFIVKKTDSNKLTFDLKAANGAVIVTSKPYDSKEACKDDILKIQANVVVAMLEDRTIRSFGARLNPKFELYKDEADQFRFKLISGDGQILIESDAYTVKSSCKNGIASVIKNASEAIIVE